MNILHIVQRYHPAIGGSELYMQKLSEHLAKEKNNKVTVLTTNVVDPEDFWKPEASQPKQLKKVENINNVKVIRCDTTLSLIKPPILSKIIRKLFNSINFNPFIRNKFDVPTSIEMLDLINQEGRDTFDVVHVTAMPYSHLFYVGYKIAQKDKARFFITPFIHLGINEHDEIRKEYLRKYHLKLYQEADRIFVQTNAEKEALIGFVESFSKTSFSRKKVIKIGLGIDMRDYKIYDPSIFRKKYRLEYPIVFYIGTNTFEKGTVTLLKAMQLLWDKEIDIHLVLAGKKVQKFEKFIKTYPYKHKVIELGEITGKIKHQLFSSGDIFCMVSKTDSFGIVYLESWYYKKPVIACDTKVFREIIDENTDGILCEFDNEEELARQIESLAKNPRKARSMGLNGFNKVKKNYQLSQKLDIIKQFYKKNT
ncbi:glycosyltransferase family 4 protein [Candidatus Dojkabacteria bacterium]|nr:glycosyltransferase family 4 protein [Candidatus Dojkabacteria bacterium]